MDYTKDTLTFALLLLCSLPSGLCQDDYDDTANIPDSPTGRRVSARCPWIRGALKNGRVKIRSRGRIAKFFCDQGYELVGKRFATCVRGQWNNPIPICVTSGCSHLEDPPNGKLIEDTYTGALLVYSCNPGYVLKGSSTIFCDGTRWNDTAPKCEVAVANPSLSCDFEDADLCGWTHDPSHDFDWRRHQFSTPSGHVETGPSFDHTFGKGRAGFYMYIEASSPRKENDTARLFSPVFFPSETPGCFTFWYHMYGATIGILRVYVKPETHIMGELMPQWSKTGEQGNQWLRGEVSIPHLLENFQLVIEGVRGSSYVGDTAIDDVSLHNSDCSIIDSMNMSTPRAGSPDSCRGRCGEGDNKAVCSCFIDCFHNGTCCSDYLKLCFIGDSTDKNENEFPEDLVPSSTAAIFTQNVTSKVSNDLTDATTQELLTTLPSSIETSTQKKIVTTLLPPIISDDFTTSPNIQSTNPVIKSTPQVEISTQGPQITTRSSKSSNSATTYVPDLKKTVLSKTTPVIPLVEKSSTKSVNTKFTIKPTNSAPSRKTQTPPPKLKTTLYVTPTKKLIPITSTKPTVPKRFTTSSPTRQIYTTKQMPTAIFSSGSSTTNIPLTTFKPLWTQAFLSTRTTMIEQTKDISAYPKVTDLDSTYTTAISLLIKNFTNSMSNGFNSSPSTSMKDSTDNSIQTVLTSLFNDTTTTPLTISTSILKENTTVAETPLVTELPKTYQSDKQTSTLIEGENRLKKYRSSRPSNSASKATKDGSSTTTIAGVTGGTLVALIVFVIIGYIIMKKRKSMQSKLSEDSEMKYLSNNEIIEYSEPTQNSS